MADQVNLNDFCNKRDGDEAYTERFFMKEFGDTERHLHSGTHVRQNAAKKNSTKN